MEQIAAVESVQVDDGLEFAALCLNNERCLSECKLNRVDGKRGIQLPGDNCVVCASVRSEVRATKGEEEEETAGFFASTTTRQTVCE